MLGAVVIHDAGLANVLVIGAGSCLETDAL